MRSGVHTRHTNTVCPASCNPVASGRWYEPVASLPTRTDPPDAARWARHLARSDPRWGVGKAADLGPQSEVEPTCRAVDAAGGRVHGFLPMASAPGTWARLAPGARGHASH